MNRRTLSALALVAVAATAAIGLQQASANSRPAASADTHAAVAGKAPVAPVAPVAPNTDPTPIAPSSDPTPIEPSPYPTPIEPSPYPTPIEPSPYPTTRGTGTHTTLDPGPGPLAGTVTGHLYGVGGMAPGTKVTWAGTVTVTGKGVRQDLTVGQDGAFAIMLDPGVYTVTGRSPAHVGSLTCSATGKATVTAGRTVTVDVVCPIP